MTRWKIYFALLATVSVVGALIPVGHPTPIADTILYLNAAFCVYSAVRV